MRTATEIKSGKFDEIDLKIREQELELMKARVRHENALADAVEKANA